MTITALQKGVKGEKGVSFQSRGQAVFGKLFKRLTALAPCFFSVGLLCVRVLEFSLMLFPALQDFFRKHRATGAFPYKFFMLLPWPYVPVVGFDGAAIIAVVCVFRGPKSYKKTTVFVASAVPN